MALSVILEKAMLGALVSLILSKSQVEWLTNTALCFHLYFYAMRKPHLDESVKVALVRTQKEEEEEQEGGCGLSLSWPHTLSSGSTLVSLK